MKITQIRNATVIIEYGGKRFLVDPMLGAKGTFAPFPMTGNKLRNPLVELPMPVAEILQGIDAVIITHTHLDHIDPTALEIMDKRLPVFVQDNKDAGFMRKHCFTNVSILGEDTRFGDVQMTKTPGKHGTFPMILLAGHTCGIIFRNDKEQTLYLASDTIWYHGVETTLDKYAPEVILINAGGNKFKGFRPVIMHEKDVLEVHRHMPKSILVATHLEGVNHNTVTRKELCKFAETNDFSDKLLIPDDGQTISL